MEKNESEGNVILLKEVGQNALKFRSVYYREGSTYSECLYVEVVHMHAYR